MRNIPAVIDRTFPLPGRFRAGLPGDVAELSRLMTINRGDRGLSYLSRPNHLSAYLRYFLPWNIFRLCRLLEHLDIPLGSGDSILDLGSGPLSFASALWISRPDLRKQPLEIRCVDRTGPILDAGKKFFAALAGPDCRWKIITIRGSINPAGYIRCNGGGKVGMKKTALVCAANVFNEVYSGLSAGDKNGIRDAADCSARLLDSFAAVNGAADLKG